MYRGGLIHPSGLLRLTTFYFNFVFQSSFRFFTVYFLFYSFYPLKSHYVMLAEMLNNWQFQNLKLVGTFGWLHLEAFLAT
jgi:hypothetical protein